MHTHEYTRSRTHTRSRARTRIHTRPRSSNAIPREIVRILRAAVRGFAQPSESPLQLFLLSVKLMMALQAYSPSTLAAATTLQAIPELKALTAKCVRHCVIDAGMHCASTHFFTNNSYLCCCGCESDCMRLYWF